MNFLFVHYYPPDEILNLVEIQDCGSLLCTHPTISKMIGMIHSRAKFYVIIVYISKTKATLTVIPQGLEILFLTYATLDFLLNLAEIIVQLIVSCCYDEDARSNTEYIGIFIY